MRYTETPMIPALTLAFFSGFVALSYELLWFRALNFTSGSEADTFGLLLGAYLVGLALGSLAARRECRETGPDARPKQLASLFRLVLAANVFCFFVVPILAWLVSRGLNWRVSLPVIGLAAAGLGTVFPVISHSWIAPDEQVGRRVSYLYLANILGSTSGSLITGFVLMDHLSLAALHLVQGLLGLGMAALPAIFARDRNRPRALAAVAVLAILCVVFGKAPFDGIYEKLQLKGSYSDGQRFTHVVENKSGVITVNSIGQIFGGGIYDGAYNTGLHMDKNAIIRCYAAMAFRPALKDVLMIGLSTGSWATVVANNPTVERLTVIEINPGHHELIPKYPDVAGLLAHPKVKIEIDDGRRWLIRNPEAKFDAIIANASHHWRSNSTNLLSKEFLELARTHLRDGGYYYYNTTSSTRIARTGCAVYPHAIRIGGFLAVSDAPLVLDYEKLRAMLLEYPRGAGTVFDRGAPGDLDRLDRTIRQLQRMVHTRPQLEAMFTPDVRLATDDNMGTEWGENP